MRREEAKSKWDQRQLLIIVQLARKGQFSRSGARPLALRFSRGEAALVLEEALSGA